MIGRQIDDFPVPSDLPVHCHISPYGTIGVDAASARISGAI